MTVSRSKRRLVLALLAAALLAPVVMRWRDLDLTLRARWLARGLRLVAPADRAEAASRLTQSNPGRRALEWVAFGSGPERESLALRTAAMRALWAFDAERPTGDRIPEERLARYVAETENLGRPPLLPALLEWTVTVHSPLLVEAAGEALRHHTEDELPGKTVRFELDLDFELCEFLDADGSDAAGLALECVVRGGQTPLLRQTAVATFELHPRWPIADAVLRHALADPSESVRFRAARALTGALHDPAGVPLVLTMLESETQLTTTHAFDAVRSLEGLGDRRAIAALVRARPRFTGTGLDLVDHALARIARTRPADGETWESWLEKHRAELPPQWRADGRSPETTHAPSPGPPAAAR